MSAANNVRTQEKLMGKAITFADREQFEQGQRGSYHPLVRTHPETGEESLYICDTYADGIEGMTTFEARPIIEFLVQHTHAARLHLPPALGRGNGRPVGQPRHDAPRAERLRRVSARNVPHDDRGRGAVLRLGPGERRSRKLPQFQTVACELLLDPRVDLHGHLAVRVGLFCFAQARPGTARP